MAALFVGGLSGKSTPLDVEALFSRFGRCRADVRTGWAFIFYQVHHDAEEAMRELNHREVFGKRIEVKWKKDPPKHTRVKEQRYNNFNRRNFDTRHRASDMPRHRMENERNAPSRQRAENSHNMPRQQHMDRNRGLPRPLAEPDHDNSKQSFVRDRDMPKQDVERHHNMPKDRWQRGLARPKQRFEERRDVPKHHFGSKRDVPRQRAERDHDKPRQHMESDCDVSRIGMDGEREVPRHSMERDVDVPRQRMGRERDIPWRRMGREHGMTRQRIGGDNNMLGQRSDRDGSSSRKRTGNDQNPPYRRFEREGDIRQQRIESDTDLYHDSHPEEKQRTERNRTFPRQHSERASDCRDTNKGESLQYYRRNSLPEGRFSSENTSQLLPPVQGANPKCDSRTNEGERRKSKRKSSRFTNISDSENILRKKDDRAPPTRRGPIFLKLRLKPKPSAVGKSVTLSDVSRDETQRERIPSSTVPEIHADTSNAVSDQVEDPAPVKLRFRSKPSPVAKSATLSDVSREETPQIPPGRMPVSAVTDLRADTSNDICDNVSKDPSEDDTAVSMENVEVVTGEGEGEGEVESESVEKTDVDKDADNSSGSSNGRRVAEELEENSRPRKRGRKAQDLDLDLQLALKLTREDAALHAPPTTRSKTRRSAPVQHLIVEKVDVTAKKKAAKKSTTTKPSSAKREMKKVTKTISKKKVGRPPKKANSESSNTMNNSKIPGSVVAFAKKRQRQLKMRDDVVSPVPCEVAEVEAEVETETKAETEEVDDGECARTRLYRRMEEKAKAKKYQFSFPTNIGKKVDSRGSTLSARDKRQISRQYKKLLDHSNIVSDAVRENELKNRNRSVFVSKSNIHGLGLFAAEDIEGGQFVLEYVAEKIRHVVADIREKCYKEKGIGDSYLFTLDQDYVLDATHRGSMGRFINHSCNPNVTARIDVVNNQKRIVFYSKRKIRKSQEITYDYCFGAEEEEKKVACLCKLSNCRKYLN